MHIIFNNRKIKVTKDSFGITYLDGLTIEIFVNQLSSEELQLASKLGLAKIKNNPRLAKDSILKHEITDLYFLIEE